MSYLVDIPITRSSIEAAFFFGMTLVGHIWAYGCQK